MRNNSGLNSGRNPEEVGSVRDNPNLVITDFAYLKPS